MPVSEEAELESRDPSPRQEGAPSDVASDSSSGISHSGGGPLLSGSHDGASSESAAFSSSTIVARYCAALKIYSIL